MHVTRPQLIFFCCYAVKRRFRGTRSVSKQFDAQDLSPQLAHARGMALVSVDHAFLSGYQIVLETAEGY